MKFSGHNVVNVEALIRPKCSGSDDKREQDLCPRCGCHREPTGSRMSVANFTRGGGSADQYRSRSLTHESRCPSRFLPDEGQWSLSVEVAS